MPLSDSQEKHIALKANEIRESIITMLMEAGSGHTAGPLGMADVFAALYFHVLKHDPHNPFWEERDMFVLSNGHIAPVLYATMAHAGYFPVSELVSLRKIGSRLQGHPHKEWLPGLETSSGPLGSGLSQALGMALAEKIDRGNDYKRFVYCATGDGELDEGQNWEAIMMAGKEKVGNLIAVVDRNNIQIDGFTEDVMPLEPLAEKWKSFNWHVTEIDGHNIEEIVDAFEKAQAVTNQPSVIIARTIPGKGVPMFERKPEWHGKPPSKEEGMKALEVLRTLGGRIKSEHQ